MELVTGLLARWADHWLNICRAETVAPYFDESKYAEFYERRMSSSWVRRMALCIGLAVVASATQLPARAEKTIEISLKDRYLKLLDSGVGWLAIPLRLVRRNHRRQQGATRSPAWKMRRSITRKEK